MSSQGGCIMAEQQTPSYYIYPFVAMATFPTVEFHYCIHKYNNEIETINFVSMITINLLKFLIKNAKDEICRQT